MPKHPDPIEDYKEWTEHRYTPGYYVGGRLPPATRGLWSSKDRVWLGTIYALGGIVGIVLSIWSAQDTVSLVYAVLGLAILYLIPGILVLFVEDGLKKRRNNANTELRT